MEETGGQEKGGQENGREEDGREENGSQSRLRKRSRGREPGEPGNQQVSKQLN
jgi:hypothetical protein